MQTGEGLSVGRHRSRKKWLGGVDSPQPWLAVSAAGRPVTHCRQRCRSLPRPAPQPPSLSWGYKQRTWMGAGLPFILGFILTIHSHLCEQDPGRREGQDQVLRGQDGLTRTRKGLVNQLLCCPTCSAANPHGQGTQAPAPTCFPMLRCAGFMGDIYHLIYTSRNMHCQLGCK